MKEKLLAVLAAVSLCLSLVGCNTATPASVGSLGEVDIPAGIYLISQFQAYQTVQGYANESQKALSVKDYLKETVYLTEDGTTAPTPAEGEEQTGEANAVSDLIASQTLENVQFYAAVETMFAQLNGTLSEDELNYAKSYADQLWENYGKLYADNGIGKSTLLTYQYSSLKASALLQMMYGPEGTEPVSTDALTDYLNDMMVYGHYISVPFYNTTDYTFADATQQSEITAALEAAVADFDKAMQADDTQDASDAFVTALEDNMEAAYAVMKNEYDTSKVAGEMASDLFGYSTLSEQFSGDALLGVTGLGINEATVIQSDYLSAMAFLRTDPLQEYTVDELQDSILVEMQSDTLLDLIAEKGTTLENGLDSAMTAQFPASKIVSE